MPNGHDKNWVRVCAAIDGFRSHFGRWPTRVRIMPISYSDLCAHALTPAGFALVSSFVQLVPEDKAEMIADDGTGAEYCYGNGIASGANADPNGKSPNPSTLEFFGQAIIRPDNTDHGGYIGLWDKDGNPVNEYAKKFGKLTSDQTKTQLPNVPTNL